MTATRDRYGEMVEEGSAATPTLATGDSGHSPDCLGGWLPDDADGRPVPCLACRPHLAARGRSQRQPRETSSAARSEKDRIGTARAPRETAEAKAQRLLSTGRLHITSVTLDSAHATCLGDNGTHQVTWARSAGWSCTCPAYGARCSHVAALRLVTVHAGRGAGA